MPGDSRSHNQFAQRHGRRWWRTEGRSRRSLAMTLPVLAAGIPLASGALSGSPAGMIPAASTPQAGPAPPAPAISTLPAGTAVGTAASPTGGGWEAYSSGGVVPFGAAVGHGSLAG